MKKILLIVIIVIIAAALVAIGVIRKGRTSTTYKIAVIPKGTTHVFWQSVHRGAADAAEEFSAEIFWNGPEREGDREKQIQIIEDFLTQKVSGFVLAPLDSKALVPSVEKIYAEGIPCVIIDSGIDTDKYVSFAATDNYKGGVIAARRMGQILDGKGKIIVLKYMPGSASTTNRENGFIETIEKEFPDIKIVDTKYGMDTVETALVAAEDLLTKNPEIDGMFAPNEPSAVGALRALQSQGRVDSVKMIGFDAGTLLVEALRAGTVDSLVIQNPYRIGYEGTKACIDKLNGQEVPRQIDTGVALLTIDNIDTPEMQALMK